MTTPSVARFIDLEPEVENFETAVLAGLGSQRSAYWSPVDWVALVMLWFLTALYAAALIAICRRRPEFLRRSPMTQWRRAALLTLLTTASQVGTWMPRTQDRKDVDDRPSSPHCNRSPTV